MSPKGDPGISPERETLQAALLPSWRRSRGDEAIWIACDDGWLGIIATLHRELAALLPDYQLYEVSQKYGELHFRVDAVPDALESAIEALIEAAQARALVTCESCGRPGHLCRDPKGWLEVVCAEHRRSGGYVSAAT